MSAESSTTLLAGQEPKWWCCLISRDGADTIGATLDSIIEQTLPPEFVVVINDGSKDETPQIVEEKSKRWPEIYRIDTKSKTRDIRRVPHLLNLGLEFADQKVRTDYMMVAGDDNELPQDYAERIISRMRKEKRTQIVVASGTFLKSDRSPMPHGAGRFVRSDFMERLGCRYPVAYGWETWLIYKALELGYQVANYPDVKYNHLREYDPKNLFGWGRAMYSLGFPTYFVLVRFVLNLLWASRGTQTRKASVTMLVGYLSAKLNSDSVRDMLISDEHLKSFVKHFSTARLLSRRI
ncbi:MAG TPA: glycosyltransferase family A protein [Nitrososphaerales archaeon]|nr:glycosyltransferase family A protein [Nitrososphaerales archaeon]